MELDKQNAENDSDDAEQDQVERTAHLRHCFVCAWRRYICIYPVAVTWYVRFVRLFLFSWFVLIGDRSFVSFLDLAIALPAT